MTDNCSQAKGERSFNSPLHQPTHFWQRHIVTLPPIASWQQSRKAIAILALAAYIQAIAIGQDIDRL